jgi:putative transcriptional regulator
MDNMKRGFVLRNRVREIRSRLKMRQADLAREVDVTRQTILAIEKGRLNPSVLVSLKIARVLREPVGYIFYLDRISEAERPSELFQTLERRAAEDSSIGFELN